VCVDGDGTIKIIRSRLSMFVYFLRTFQVITLNFMSLNMACFVFWNNDGSAFVVLYVQCI